MKVTAIDPQSPLFGLIRPGFKLLSLNGEPIQDNIDIRFKMAEEAVAFEFEGLQGEKIKFTLKFETCSEVGLTFEEDRIITCRNKCLFCFVHQQPKGMRHALYVRDDDYRLSFTHGNFISLANLSATDMKRIVDQRLSPLYVSVHATDETLRRCIFKNEKLPAILPQLKYLTAKGITVHAQVVICPGINDGEHLEKTMDDLARLYPGVKTLGIVPVGLTRYRERLPKLVPYNRETASELLHFLHKKQKKYLTELGSRFVFAADEFYILSDTNIPKISEYEEMSQFENGIGMIRSLLIDFNRRKKSLTPPDKSIRAVILTGTSAHDILKRHIIAYLKKNLYQKIDILPVENRFWGETVTVSGLLTGQDLKAAIKSHRGHYDLFMLPPNCLNGDNLFLDNISFDELRDSTRCHIIKGHYSMIDTLKEAWS
ncbi:conserved hypothetical protein [Candidatus Zixiibacteriota bacterium]|nr:conserved hypothetical protein [candidate division Zixibacteria bacterium]